MSQNISKHISFPPQLLNKIVANASVYGVSVAEYIRHLAINDDVKKVPKQSQEEWEDSLPVYTATDEKWTEWDNAKKEGEILTVEEFSKQLLDV